MSVKSIRLGSSGGTVKFGRRRPVARMPRLALQSYIKSSLPAPPSSITYAAKAAAALKKVYMNDTLGDCVIAGMGHVVGVLTGNSGTSPFLYNNKQIVSLYSAIGGYVPGDPSTDNGCDEQTALAYWENQGAPAGSTHKIVGWLAVDPTNAQECKTAIYLFENLVFGMELPDKWINPAPSKSGFTWDVAGASDPENGHCVVGLAYNNKGVTIATWGMTGLLTYAAIAKYAAEKTNGELYTVVSLDALNKLTAKAPNGFDWSQLIADFDSLGGNIPTPSLMNKLSRK